MSVDKGTPMIRYSMARKEVATPDDKLIIKGGVKPLPPDHWCEGCGYATRMTDRYMCPFTEGACVRIPGSLEKPSPEILHARITYDRIYTEAHKEAFSHGGQE